MQISTHSRTQSPPTRRAQAQETGADKNFLSECADTVSLVGNSLAAGAAGVAGSIYGNLQQACQMARESSEQGTLVGKAIRGSAAFALGVAATLVTSPFLAFNGFLHGTDEVCFGPEKFSFGQAISQGFQDGRNHCNLL